MVKVVVFLCLVLFVVQVVQVESVCFFRGYDDVEVIVQMFFLQDIFDGDVFIEVVVFIDMEYNYNNWVDVFIEEVIVDEGVYVMEGILVGEIVFNILFEVYVFDVQYDDEVLELVFNFSDIIIQDFDFLDVQVVNEEVV